MHRVGTASSIAILVALVVAASLGAASTSLTDDEVSTLQDLTRSTTGEDLSLRSDGLLVTVDDSNLVHADTVDRVTGTVYPADEAALVTAAIRTADGTTVQPMTRGSIDPGTGTWTVDVAAELSDGDHEVVAVAVNATGVATTKTVSFTVGSRTSSLDGYLNSSLSGSLACPVGWEATETGCSYAGALSLPEDGKQALPTGENCGLDEAPTLDGRCAPIDTLFPTLDVGGNLSASLGCGSLDTTRPECSIAVDTPPICAEPGYGGLGVCVDGGIGFRTFCSDRPEDVLCATTMLDGTGGDDSDGSEDSTPGDEAARDACAAAGASGPGVAVGLNQVPVKAASVSAAKEATVPVGDEVVEQVKVLVRETEDRAVCFRERQDLPGSLPAEVVAECKGFQLEVERVTTGEIVEIVRGQIHVTPQDGCRAEAAASIRAEPELKLYHWTGQLWTTHDLEGDGSAEVAQVRSFSPFVAAFSDPGATAAESEDADDGTGDPWLGPIDATMDWLELMPTWLLAVVFSLVGAGGLGLGIRLSRRFE